MKKILRLLALILTINACDDGDVTVQNISFEDVAASANCGEIVYKINQKDALLIKMTDINNTAFKNEVTLSNAPRVVAISGTTQVLFRIYNSVPSSGNFCTLPPAATPSVTEEWNAIGGTIEITTTAVKSDANATTGATRIIKYNHYIVFKNIIFQKPSGTQLYDKFVFGNYQTNPSLLFPSGNQSFTKCSLTTNTIYYQSDKEGIVLSSLDQSLFANIATTTPRISNLTATANVLAIKVYNSTIPVAYFCASPVPITPTLVDEWKSDLTATAGTIEVTTTLSSGVYTHNIHLKNVTVKRVTGNTVNFYLANDYNLGDVTTP